MRSNNSVSAGGWGTLPWGTMRPTPSPCASHRVHETAGVLVDKAGLVDPGANHAREVVHDVKHDRRRIYLFHPVVDVHEKLGKGGVTEIHSPPPVGEARNAHAYLAEQAVRVPQEVPECGRVAQLLAKELDGLAVPHQVADAKVVQLAVQLCGMLHKSVDVLVHVSDAIAPRASQAEQGGVCGSKGARLTSCDAASR